MFLLSVEEFSHCKLFLPQKTEGAGRGGEGKEKGGEAAEERTENTGKGAKEEPEESQEAAGGGAEEAADEDRNGRAEATVGPAQPGVHTTGG